jgi:hypothetical protein
MDFGVNPWWQEGTFFNLKTFFNLNYHMCECTLIMLTEMLMLKVINVKVSVKEMLGVMLMLVLSLGVIRALFHQHILILGKEVKTNSTPYLYPMGIFRSKIYLHNTRYNLHLATLLDSLRLFYYSL